MYLHCYRSNGTLVSIGLRDDGMEVAVKRLPKCNSRFIKNELENLRIPEIEHENIVKYRVSIVLYI